ncbi:MAG: ATP-binding cassette domain-containing protein [Actinomycetota bacterium]
MINISDLEVSFGRTRALTRIDLELRPVITGLFGPNAAGKSTLLRVLAALQEFERGAVLYEGRPVSLGDEGFRRLVGYVGHDSGLYPGLTVRENLNLFARLYGVPSARVDGVIDELDLAPFAKLSVGALSAGYRRRAAVARALIHSPQILLLDEPYANLDDEASDRVSAAIRNWWSDGRYAVVASHGAKRVKAFADASIILQQGRVVSYRVRLPEGVKA